MKTMKLEGFINRTNATTSHKFGIFSLGQYGGKIGNLFAGLKDNANRNCYDVVAVNSFAGDLKPLTNISSERKYVLKGVEGGCGRKPELAKEALQNKDNQSNLIDKVKKYFDNDDMYLVTAGLGGGTGTGTVTTAVKLIHAIKNKPLLQAGKKPKPIGVIATLPRKIEPLVEKKNALKAIKELEELMESKKTNLKFIIFVDNEKSFNDFKKLKADNSTYFNNWMDYSNYQVVSTLHEINVATSFSSDKAFDPQDLKNVFEEWEGAMTFGKSKFPISDIKDSNDLVEKAINTFHEGCVLANGFDLKKSRTAGVMIIKPKFNNIVNENNLDDIEVKMAEEMPGALYRPTGYVDWNNPKDVIIYTIAKVAEMPKRAREELNEEYSKVYNDVKGNITQDKATTNFDDIEDDIFSSSTNFDNTEDLDPFADKKEEKEETKENEIDVFSWTD